MDADPHQDASGKARRITFLAVLTLLLASFASLLVGLFGGATWGASMMAYSGAVESGASRELMRVVLYFLLAGPYVAGLSLLTGWIVFWFRRPGAGVMWVFLPPLIWAGLLTGYMWTISSFCGGQFTCGI